MASTDLGACEWFVWNLQRSNLIDRGQLDQIVSEFLKTHPRADAQDLAKYLVKGGVLTPFQVERVLEDKAQGLVLGPYTLTDALGSGSMGTVYQATSKNDDRWYAVKVLPRRSMWNVRIARRQVRAFEQCRHPAVVPFVDVGTSGGTHYLAWPFVEGVPLETIVQQHGPLEPSLAAYYALQTAEGLNVCHQQNLIHGLLKPSNLMITEDNQVRILDYGIGSLLAESGEGESLVDTMSTANTMTSGLDCSSPESIMDPTARTPAGDQYSLGCVLYYCLTGQYPFPEGTAVEKMMAHQMKQPTPIAELRPDVPPELSDVVARLMEKAPEARFPALADLIEILRGWVDASPPPAQRPAVAIAAKAPPDLKTAAAEGSRSGNGKAKEAPAPMREAPPAPAAPPPSARTAPTRSAPALPSRDSFRKPTAPPAPPPSRTREEAPPADLEPVDLSPNIVSERSAAPAAAEEKLGTKGTIILAVLVAIGAWFAMQLGSDFLKSRQASQNQPAPKLESKDTGEPKKAPEIPTPAPKEER
jgi:serine/threonine-protein kinase